MVETGKRLAIREKFAYGLGDSAANFVFQTQITFLMFFYTDVARIEAGAAGMILLLSRVADAFNDPIMGALADRTRTRWGRYRPWILFSAVPLALALVLCYTAPNFGQTGRIVWAAVTYNLLMILYASNNIPYCALSGVMTDDSAERTSLATWRFVCAMAAALVVNMFTLDLVKFFGRGDDAFGYQCTMALWGVLVVIFSTITFAYTKERIAPTPKRRPTLRQDLSDLFRNGPWITLFLLAILIYIQLALRSGTLLYYFSYYLHRKDLYGVFNGVGLGATIVGVLLSKPLAQRFGKRRTFRTCLVVAAVLMALFGLVPRESIGALFALQVLFQLAFGPTIPLLWAMMADVADYSEWKTNRRSTALVFGSIVLGLKLGFGIGGWLNGELLQYFGYSEGAAQSAATVHGIIMMISLFPAATLLAGAAVLYSYSINDQLEHDIQQALRDRRIARGSQDP